MCGSVAVPAGTAATKRLGGIPWWAASAPGRNQQEHPVPHMVLSSRVPLVQPGLSLLLEPFPAGPYPQNFTFGWKCPGFVSAEALVPGGVSPHAVQRGLGSSAGLSVARAAAVPPRPSGKRLGQTVNVEHKSWWRQGRSEQGGRSSKALQAERLRP